MAEAAQPLVTEPALPSLGGLTWGAPIASEYTLVDSTLLTDGPVELPPDDGKGWVWTNFTTPGQDINYSFSSGTSAAITAATPYTYSIGYDVSATAATSPYTIRLVAGDDFTAGNTIYFNADATSSYTITVDSNGTLQAYTYEPEKPEETVRREIRKRLNPQEVRRRRYLEALKSPEEQRARDSLRDLLTESEWRRYVTNSFIMVKGPSGKHYQVFNDQRHIQVFEKGQNVASLCIHTDRECPPTDHIINMKLLIEFDEAQVWRGANVNWKNESGLLVNSAGSIAVSNSYYQEHEAKNLVDLFKSVKKRAG